MVDTKQMVRTETCLRSLKSRGYKIYATHLDGGRPIEECDFSAPVALCFGNEQDGASEVLTDMADEKVFLPCTASYKASTSLSQLRFASSISTENRALTAHLSLSLKTKRDTSKPYTSSEAFEIPYNS